MQPATREETRFLAAGNLCRGVWVFPRKSPPLPLIFLLAPSSREPDPRLQRALSEAGLASFLMSWLQESQDHLEELLPAAWKHARTHPLISRRRLGLLSLGGQAPAILRLLSGGALDSPPEALVLAAPPVGLFFPPLPPLSAMLLFPDSWEKDQGPLPGEALLARARHSGLRARCRLLEDTTPTLQRPADARATRPLLHPLLGRRLAVIFHGLLGPAWQQPARPPGTAIGGPTEG